MVHGLYGRNENNQRKVRIKGTLVRLASSSTNTQPHSTTMPPSPYQPRDIVRVLASVNHTLHAFFYDNSRLSTTPGSTKTNKSGTPTPETFSPPSRNRPKSVRARPGVIIDLAPDYATVAMFTTLRGTAPSDVKGLLRSIIATIIPANIKRDLATSGGLPAFAVHPTWHTQGAAKHSLCLCLKHQVPIKELKPWSQKRKPAMAGERFQMRSTDLRLLQQLCERNERLRGLFTSEIRWLFEELSLDDFVKRRG